MGRNHANDATVGPNGGSAPHDNPVNCPMHDSAFRHKLGPFGRLRLRPASTTRTARSYSLRVSIALLYTTLICALGAVLIIHSYERHRALALDDATKLFSEVARNTAATASALYTPVEALIEQTARITTTGKSINKLPLPLDYFTESLANNSQLDALYLGFDNGDFFLVRKLPGDPETRRAFAAPDEANYITQRIENDHLNTSLNLTSYYDANLQLVSVNSDFNTGYDPRSRPWYRAAVDTDRTIFTQFYRFFNSGEIGTTVARRMRGSGGIVVGADLRLDTISSRLGSPSLTESARIVLFTESGDIVGYNDAQWLKRRTREAVLGKLRSPLMSDINAPEVSALFNRFVAGERDGQMTIGDGGDAWFGSIIPIDFGPNKVNEVYTAILTPESELLSGQNSVRLQSVLLSLLALVIAVALAWRLSISISRSTEALAVETKRIQRLQLEGPVSIRSRISEIDHLASTIDSMKSALRRFVALTNATVGELDIDALGDLAIEHIAPACDATTATVLLLSEDKRRLVRVHSKRKATGNSNTYAQAADFRSDVIELPDTPLPSDKLCPDQHAAFYRESVWIDDIGKAQGFDTRNYHSHSVLVLPLLASNDELVGVIHLGDIRKYHRKAFHTRHWLFAKSLAAHAGMAFENQRLAEGRRSSFDALIRLLAQAIDAKSPHTSKHCQRVPILCSLLAEAASESRLPAFRDYSLTDAAREEFDIASWLHDCGKVTTPDHIIDKATKLSTIHNRIHDIRTRFEVLWRDAEIKYLRTLLQNSGIDPTAAKLWRDQTQSALFDDFAFLAHCNVGTETLDSSAIERIRMLSKRTWIRHFDDKLGLSADELARRNAFPDEPLPTREPLLSDKPFQRIARNTEIDTWGDNPHGFDMPIPANEVDDGEVHNLTIKKGTLNEEDRFRVNDHVVQTIEMLEAIPFPRELSQVPRIAGNHHERLDGTGYPRRRIAAELGIEDRILAISDIFEALTASDRPYRKARTTEAAIQVMRSMCEKGELCADLFNLFLDCGLHHVYAEHLEQQRMNAHERQANHERGTTDFAMTKQRELQNDVD